MTAETYTDEFLDTASPGADETTDTDETAYRQSLDSSGIMSGAFGLTCEQLEARHEFQKIIDSQPAQLSCQKAPETWFDTKSSNNRQYAIGHCLACPIVEHCRQYADSLDPDYGIWAGEIRTRQTPRKGQS